MVETRILGVVLKVLSPLSFSCSFGRQCSREISTLSLAWYCCRSLRSACARRSMGPMALVIMRTSKPISRLRVTNLHQGGGQQRFAAGGTNFSGLPMLACDFFKLRPQFTELGGESRSFFGDDSIKLLSQARLERVPVFIPRIYPPYLSRASPVGFGKQWPAVFLASFSLRCDEWMFELLGRGVDTVACYGNPLHAGHASRGGFTFIGRLVNKALMQWTAR